MQKAQDYYPDCPEPLLVSLARGGDRAAFEEIVRRRQSWIRRLMQRCCGDANLADDLAQQVFLQVWLKLRGLKEAAAFGGWIKRLAISIWLQHLRRNDALRHAEEYDDHDGRLPESPGEAMDLESALATLSETVRLCIVLSYHEGMSHKEIVEATGMPLGTIKSHINRGTKRLRECLSAYDDDSAGENSHD